MNHIHGKGDFMYEDGSKESGHCVKGLRQGRFEYFDRNETLTQIKIYEDDKVIKCEEVKQEI